MQGTRTDGLAGIAITLPGAVPGDHSRGPVLRQIHVPAPMAAIQDVVIMDVVVLADGTIDANRIRITRSLDPDSIAKR
jgi:hypothetical protein